MWLEEEEESSSASSQSSWTASSPSSTTINRGSPIVIDLVSSGSSSLGSPEITQDLRTPGAPQCKRSATRINNTSANLRCRLFAKQPSPTKAPVFGETHEEDATIQYDQKEGEDATNDPFNEIVVLDKELIIRIGWKRYLKCVASSDNMYVQIGTVFGGDSFTCAMQLLPMQVREILTRVAPEMEPCSTKTDCKEYHIGYRTVVRKYNNGLVTIGEMVDRQSGELEGIHFFDQECFQRFITALEEASLIFPRCRTDVLCDGHKQERERETCPACVPFSLTLSEESYFYKD